MDDGESYTKATLRIMSMDGAVDQAYIVNSDVFSSVKSLVIVDEQPSNNFKFYTLMNEEALSDQVNVDWSLLLC